MKKNYSIVPGFIIFVLTLVSNQNSGLCAYENYPDVEDEREPIIPISKKDRVTFHQKSKKPTKKIIYKRVAKHLDDKSYKSLGEWLSKNVRQGSDLNMLYKFANHLKADRLKDAIVATQNIMKQTPKVKLSRGEVLQLALFIETNIKNKASDDKYFDHKKTKLPCSIEVDPKNGNIIVYLEKENSGGVGKGCWKKFNISLLYSVDSPRIITTGAIKKGRRSAFRKRLMQEVDIMKKLNGKTGIVKLYSFLQNRGKKGAMVFAEKLYKCGSIRKLLDKRKYHFTAQEKTKLTADFIAGLRAMHKKGIIHRDLHTGNFLVDVSNKGKKRMVSGAITDFGKVQVSKNLRKRGHAGYKAKTDIFRLGIAMYGLLHDKYIDIHSENKEARKKAIVSSRKRLEEKSKHTTLNSNERLEYLVVNMINRKKSEIKNIDEIYKDIKKIKKLQKNGK